MPQEHFIYHTPARLTCRNPLRGLKSYRFGLWHVRDDAVGDDEQDEVLWAVNKVARYVGYVVDGRREVGRAVQLDPLDATAVRTEHTWIEKGWNGFKNSPELSYSDLESIVCVLRNVRFYRQT